MPNKPPQQDRFLRSDEVYRLTGYKRTSIDRFIRSGKFPTPARAGGVLLFSEQEVQHWIEQRKAAVEVSK